jgi:hypothetical protein
MKFSHEVVYFFLNLFSIRQNYFQGYFSVYFAHPIIAKIIVVLLEPVRVRRNTLLFKSLRQINKNRVFLWKQKQPKCEKNRKYGCSRNKKNILHFLF